MPSNSDVYSMNSDEKIISNCFGFSFHPLETFTWSEGFNDANSAMPISLIKY
jgi:hypothetical protein